MTFIDAILGPTKELESPTSFWYWAGLVSISSILKDNVWIDRAGLYKLYPNIYVMLHAESGLKKGPPINLAKELITKVNNTKIISGRSSIQGILKEMGTAETKPGGKIETKSHITIVSSELSSSIVEDKVAATILTDLYDRHYNAGDWKSLLKMESFQLKDPTITMFTATNEAHNEDFFTKRDIQGGFYARTFIIHETHRQNINSLVVPPKQKLDKDALTCYLKELAKLRGEFKPLGSRIETEYCNIPAIMNGETVYLSRVGKLYNDWYEEFSRVTEGMQDETGTVNRFGDAVLKVAMLISLSKKPELELDVGSMNEAISQCEKLIGNVRKTTMGRKGKSSYALQKTLVIEELMKRDNHMMTRTQLNKKYWMHCNSDEWDLIMKSFDDAGMILTETMGNNIVYRMPTEQVKKMTDFLSGKGNEQ
jgi:hypothetical protein